MRLLSLAQVRKLSILMLATAIGIHAEPVKADRISDLEDQVRLLQESLSRIQVQLQAERGQPAPRSPNTTVSTATSSAAQSTHPTNTAAPASPEAQEQPAWPKGYIPVPGTSTAVKFGGAIRAEVWDDVQSTQGGRTDDATAIPARGTAKANRNGALNGSISGSRFNFGTLSHTEIGDMKSFLEFDLGTDASPTFRLRHAYIANADWLAGQTWSTFMDMDSLPDLLSAGGSVGYSWLRRPQVRYSIQTGDRDKLDMAAEVPTSDYSAPSAINTAPDLVLKYTAGQSWGHYALGGMVRYLRSDTGTGDKADQIVWGFLGGVSIKTFGDDILTLQTVDGTGVGGALNQGTGLSAAVVNRSFQTFDAFGGSLAYKHYWNPKLRSTLAVGYDQFANASRNIGTNGLGIRSLASVHGNIVYSPIAPMDVGIEYGYEAFTASPTGTGTASRVLGVVKYGY
ncbi:DcaP family trimeric outer membrane transporter [Paramagnetospirillum caucaseum]|jgi:hypothetical protein|nr:DcaP family trimeric outer membrane transporter [Paramagnetospirillum caucaseum]